MKVTAMEMGGWELQVTGMKGATSAGLCAKKGQRSPGPGFCTYMVQYLSFVVLSPLCYIFYHCNQVFGSRMGLIVQRGKWMFELHCCLHFFLLFFTNRLYVLEQF